MAIKYVANQERVHKTVSRRKRVHKQDRQLKIRIDGELHDAFAIKCAEDGVTVSDALRDFMREKTR